MRSKNEKNNNDDNKNKFMNYLLYNNLFIYVFITIN